MGEVDASKPPSGAAPNPEHNGPASAAEATRPGPAAAAETSIHDAGAEQRAIGDIWSRTEPKYRIRAVALLLVNLVLFCGLCVFTHWLHVARPFDFSWDSYVDPLRFRGEQTQNLNDFVLYPISVEQNRMHGVVLGLLVASIVAVPISVAILYRFPLALPFTAAVLIFAHMPWMAFTLVGSCTLAAVRPFRLSFRFGAALVGMLPIIVYLYLATRGTPQQITTYASPDQKLLLAAPWILAILAACAMLGAILWISRLVNHRPGAVAPVMAIMFATPAILFYTHVGVDEVSYRVLEDQYGPRSPRFAVLDVTDRVLAMLESRLDESTRQEVLGVFFGRPESQRALRQRVARQLVRDFLVDRREAYEACSEFIADHPDSRYVPNVLFMQGWVLDARLDTRVLLPPHFRSQHELPGDYASAPSFQGWLLDTWLGRRTSLSPGIRLLRVLYSDYPHVQSSEPWGALLAGHPDSPLAIAAHLRLALLHLRQGEIDVAFDQLARLQASAASRTETQSSTRPAARPRLGSAEPESSLAFDPEPYWREAQRLYELIRDNRDDARYGTAPLQALACLDPQRPGYRQQLLRLMGEYPDAELHDNLLVLWAASLPDRDERAAALEGCIRDFPTGDAVAEAMFRLADLDMQARGEEREARRQRGLERMADLAKRFGHSRWGQEAAERLRILQPPADSARGPTESP